MSDSSDSTNSQMTIDSIGDFLAWVEEGSGVKILYRGIRSFEWEVSASLYRRLLLGFDERHVEEHEFWEKTQELLDLAEDMGFHYEEHGKDNLLLLARLQHYGAATCLIDFTRNPLVALWFACQPCTKCQQGEKDRDLNQSDDVPGKVVAINVDSSKRYSKVKASGHSEAMESWENQSREQNSKKFRLWRWPPEQQNKRIIAQQSEFIFGRTVIRPDRECIIPAAQKRDILGQLRKIGVSEESLFPDFSGFARINGYDRAFPYTSGERHFKYGKERYEKKKYEQSADHFQRAARGFENNDLDVKERLSNAYEFLARGRKFLKEEKYAEAIKCFTNAAELFRGGEEEQRGRGDALLGLAQARFASGEREAESVLVEMEEVMALIPNVQCPHIFMGDVQRSMKKYPAAVESYDNALKINPENARTFFKRGRVKQAMKAHKDAIKDYDQALKINSSVADAYFNRAYCKERTGDISGAISDCTKGLEINPRSLDAYFLRGQCYTAVLNYEVAIGDYSNLLYIDPEHKNAYNNRAGCKSRLGDYDGAIADLERALEIDPEFETARKNLEKIRAFKENM